MLNRIVIMGRLTWDPELRRTQNGISVTRFRVAVERNFKSQNGERETDFIDCVAWRNTAEFVSKYFTKGRMAVVEGSLQVRDWTDQDGGKRRSAEVVADNVYFGDSKRDGGDYGAPGGYGGAPGYGSGSGYGGAPGYGSNSGYGGGSGYGGNSGYGGAPGYGNAPGYGGTSAPAPGYGDNAAPGYGNTSAPAPGYNDNAAPGYGGASSAAPSDFSEISEEDGDLPF